MIKKTVYGGVLATLREEAGLKQAELAELVGCSQGWLSRIETTPQRTSLPVIERIAAALSDQLGRTITTDDLVDDSNFCPRCRTPLARTA